VTDSSSRNLFDVAGRVAIVTGASSGFGDRFTRFLSAGGAHVIACARRLDRLEALAAEVPNVVAVQADVADDADCARLVATAVERFGRLDVLVNNAGIARIARLVNTSLADWDTTIAVNQTGVFLGMRAAARAMIAAGNGGSIVNISSIAGMEGMFGSTAYGASKWAVRGMTKIAAKELGKHGVRVNSVHPGFIDTDMLAQGNFGEEDHARLARRAPVGRVGLPEDIANMVVYLCSDAASFVTGQEFVVDGGVHG
jgi:3alpha(or 20beta)-hydroxysteroid dehydrogenase